MMAKDVLNDLKTTASPTLNFLDNAYIMNAFDKMEKSNPQRFNQFLAIANGSRSQIYILNQVLRVKDRYIEGMSPENKQRYANEIGHTIQAAPMREDSVDETATPDAVKRIEQMVQYK
jgi:phytoene/squalene synthetase